jgi:hypothetical protein
MCSNGKRPRQVFIVSERAVTLLLLHSCNVSNLHCLLLFRIECSTVKDQRDAAKIEQEATQKLADDVKAAIKVS